MSREKPDSCQPKGLPADMELIEQREERWEPVVVHYGCLVGDATKANQPSSFDAIVK